MEIKTNKEIHKELFDMSVSEFNVYKHKKWVAVDDLEKAIAYYEKNDVGRYEDFKGWLRKELGLNTVSQSKMS